MVFVSAYKLAAPVFKIRKLKMLGYRLSKHVIPCNYDLCLHPDLISGKFEGYVNITVKVKKVLNRIYFHANTLNLTNVKLLNSENNEVKVENYYTCKENELAVLDLAEEIQPGKYDIQIDFDGDLTNRLVGFYSSRFKDNTKIVSSKFEPTYARQAFPCFDEPGFKATYDVKLVKPRDYIALSNMNQISEVKKGSDSDVVTFAKSVPMSTYLICFVICNFECIEDEIDTKTIGDQFILRSFGRKDQLNKIVFPQNIGKRAVEFYIQYYGVPFPLPKLDMIAIPDYVSGATEHWGLITFRETAFLADMETSSANNLVRVATVVCHELAHMWFGNLVTMKWWDDIWLNEGFATFMQLKSLNSIEPTWEMMDQFLPTLLHPVLQIDDKLSSHPIVQKAETPDEINSLFDRISYNKGASILRQLENFIGEKDFECAITDYLVKYQYGNTKTSDLFETLTTYFSKNNKDHDLTHIMDTWTRQMGYPIVTVKDGPEPNTFILSQKRFLVDPDAVGDESSPFNYRWYIPITFKTNLGPHIDIVWFDDTKETIKLKFEDEVQWIKLNNDQVGYYRVNYTQVMWRKLICLLKGNHSVLTRTDRAHLIEEIYQLAAARVVSYELPLNLTTYLRAEMNYVPWLTASSCFSDMRKRLLHSETYSLYVDYIKELIQPIYATFSWNADEQLPIVQRLLRTLIFDLACLNGLPDAVSQARKLFEAWLSNPAKCKIEPDLRNIVYYYGMMDANECEWQSVFRLYMKEEDPQETAKLMRALAAPKDVMLLQKYLNYAWDESKVRSQDYLTILIYLSENPAGTALVWDFYRENWQQLVSRYTINSRVLGGTIVEVTRSFDTHTKLHELEEFFCENPEAGAGATSRAIAIENVKHNIAWNKLNRDTVHGWLQNHLAKQFTNVKMI